MLLKLSKYISCADDSVTVENTNGQIQSTDFDRKRYTWVLEMIQFYDDIFEKAAPQHLWLF